MPATMPIVSALLALARNAIPFLGVLIQDWAAPSALLLYLGENCTLSLLGALFVRLRASKDEVIDGERKTRREVLQVFALISGPFTFGAAAITSVVLLARSEYVIQWDELLAAFMTMIVLQLMAFATNMARNREVTLAASETMLTGILLRVFLLAFAVWAGLLLAIFITPVFVVPFMILKTIVDLTQLRPESLKRRLLRAV